VGGLQVATPILSSTGGQATFSEANCSKTVTVSVRSSGDEIDSIVSPWVVGLRHSVNGDDGRFASAVLRPTRGLVNVSVYDDDQAAVLLSRSDISVGEGGSNDTYTV